MKEMEKTPRVMMVSRKAESCGIAQYGKRVAHILSQRYNVFHLQTSDPSEFHRVYFTWQPTHIIYNYYSPILPWINDDLIADKRSKTKHILIYHEVDVNFTPDAIVDVDSTQPDKPEIQYYGSPRPLFENFEFETPRPNDIPTIGTFGFGFSDKNFKGLTEVVCDHFDQARIRMHIGHAEFGDGEGNQAKERIEECKQIIGMKNSGIILEPSHHFMNDYMLMNWLHSNDLNFFYYPPNIGRGLSSVIDYALSAKKPIAISRSSQFKHILPFADEFVVPGNKLKDIINRGISPLEKIYDQHSNENLLNLYSKIIN